MTKEIITPESELDLLVQTDNGWHVGDPVEQPSQDTEVNLDD